jgi:Methyltransferase domain
MKRALKRIVPERARLYIRRANRLRWITKAKTLRRNGPGAWRGRPLRQARYVLCDPEVDTFTYSIANLDQLARQLALVLDQPTEEVEAHLAEALKDPELGSRLSRDIGWRALFTKRRPPLPSHHLSAWATIRSCKPALVVETGILEGLGDRIMLRALQLNAAEGTPGRLMSFDIMPGSGRALVPERLSAAWEPIYEPTPEALGDRLEGREVGLFLHDSVGEADHLRSELEAVYPHMVPGGILMTVHGWIGVLEEEAARLGGRCETFRERPRDHFYGGRALSWMRLPR